MKPVDLIKNSVANALTQAGYTPGTAMFYANDAADYYKRMSNPTSKGPYADCLAYATKRAKQGVRK